MYKKDTDTLRTKNTTLLTLIQALLNYEEEDAFELVRQIRSCDSLEEVAQSIMGEGKVSTAAEGDTIPNDEGSVQTDQFESELAGKMSELMLNGSRKFIGGTSNLIFLPPGSELNEFNPADGIHNDFDQTNDRSITRWTRVTDDEQLISHLMTMYFTWHYPFFTTLSKDLFYRDYVRGVSSQYCSSLLVNAMLALGCHFSSWQGGREDPRNSATAGDHFFREARRLILENDEHLNAKLCTVQALALMSVREAGCGREGKGWVYSGMSFRMALDLGLNVDSTSLGTRNLNDEEVDARRVTFWGCFLFDKFVFLALSQSWIPFLIPFLDAGQIISVDSLNYQCLILAYRRSISSPMRRLHCGLHTQTQVWAARTRNHHGLEQWHSKSQSYVKSAVI